jgi:hypothetical protein
VRACNREKWGCAQIKSRIKKQREGAAKRGGNGRKVMHIINHGLSPPTAISSSMPFSHAHHVDLLDFFIFFIIFKKRRE